MRSKTVLNVENATAAQSRPVSDANRGGCGGCRVAVVPVAGGGYQLQREGSAAVLWCASLAAAMAAAYGSPW